MAVVGNNILIMSDGNLIAGTRSNDIGTECELQPISSPLSGKWRNYKAGRKGWTITVNFLMTTVDDITVVLHVGNEYTLRVYARNGGKTMSGSAICQVCRITATVGNLVQGTFQFVGDGELAEVNP